MGGGQIWKNMEEHIATSDNMALNCGLDNETKDVLSSRPMPSFKDKAEESGRAKSKRKNAERSMLDDRLTHYFSPTSSKRTTKARQDIQDNQAITEALLKKSPKKRVGRSIDFTSTPSQQHTVSDDKEEDISTQHSATKDAVHNQDPISSHLTPAEVYKKTIKNQNLAVQKLQKNYKSSPISNSIHHSLKNKINTASKRQSLSKPIKTPNSEFSFNSSVEQEKDVSLPDQSNEFYTCTTCNQPFPHKKDYISHYKVCLLSSNVGVLFDKVTEKVPEPKEESVDKENARKDKKSDLNKNQKKKKKIGLKKKKKKKKKK